MADISDVENALVALIQSAVYPLGVSQPSAVVVNGTPIDCRIFPGWPLPGNIDADMAHGTPPGSSPIVSISVFTQTGLERSATRFPRDWKTATVVPCSMTATVNGAVVTIGGTVTAGHYISIQAGNYGAAYAAKAGDTVSDIAAALGAQFSGAYGGSTGLGYESLLITLGVGQGSLLNVSGPTITFPPWVAGRITARTAAPGTSIRELDRTNQRFAITIWAPNNTVRVATARVIRPVLAATDFVTLPDGYAGQLRYESSTDIDRTGKQGISCRDLYWWVEYPTTQTMVSYPVTTFSVGVESDTATTTISHLPLPSFTPTITIIK